MIDDEQASGPRGQDGAPAAKRGRTVLTPGGRLMAPGHNPHGNRSCCGGVPAHDGGLAHAEPSARGELDRVIISGRHLRRDLQRPVAYRTPGPPDPTRGVHPSDGTGGRVIVNQSLQRTGAGTPPWEDQFGRPTKLCPEYNREIR